MTGAKLRGCFAGCDALNINTSAAVIQRQRTALLTLLTGSQDILLITTRCELLVDANCSLGIESRVASRIRIHRIEVRIELVGHLDILISAWSIRGERYIRNGGG